jgi:hypothetical protein
MRALTLTQPWAGLVASGIKGPENRSRNIIKPEHFGQRFAIHASRVVDLDVYNRIREIAPELRHGEDQDWYRMSTVKSAVIGTAVVRDSIYIGQGIKTHHWDFLRHWYGSDRWQDQLRWAFGPFVYLTTDHRFLRAPVPCAGKLGFWTLPPTVEEMVKAADVPV